jgi:hypothetical protein
MRASNFFMLDDAQDALLIDLAEADRRVPRKQRQPFYIAETIGPPGVQIIHDGWREKPRKSRSRIVCSWICRRIHQASVAPRIS